MSTRADQEKRNAALFSLAAAVALTALKLIVGVSTNSLGVLAEAAHSALDLLAALMTFLAVRISSRPPDKTHPYGHGKVENLSALAETILLLLTCGWIVNEAVQRLFFEHEQVNMSVWAIGVMVFSIGVDFTRSSHLKHVARKHKSQALEADALHFSTDMLSSLVVIFGLILVWIAEHLEAGSTLQRMLHKADAVSALIVACVVAWVSLSLGRRAVDQLLDVRDSTEIKLAEQAVAEVPEVVRLARLRIRDSGPYCFGDMTIILPAIYSLEEAHAVTEKVEARIRAVLPDADITVHYEPEENAAGEGSFMEQLHRSALRHGLDVHAVEAYQQNGPNGEKTFITLHAEVDGNMILQEAHAAVNAFEKELWAPGREIITHLEPYQERRTHTLVAPDQREAGTCAYLERKIAAIVQQDGVIDTFHRPHWLNTSQGLALSFHCCLPGSMTVRESHKRVTSLELIVKKACPEIVSLTIHADPSQ